MKQIKDVFMIGKDSQSSIFVFEGEKVRINPKALFIPEFSDLYERDHSTGKKKALKELSYVYFMADYHSEYNSYGLSKERQLGIDIFMNRNYKPDPYVQKAIDKYIQLQQTPSMRYLLSMRQRINSVIDYLDNAQIKDSKRKDDEVVTINPFITIDKITSTMSKIEDILEKVEKWEKKVFEEEEDMKIRGGGMLNAFEDPDTATWLIKK